MTTLPMLAAAAVTRWRPTASVAPVAELADDARSRARTNLRGAGSGCSDKEIQLYSALPVQSTASTADL